MRIPENFTYLVWAWIALAVITFVYLLYRPAPYGRHTSFSWGPVISNRVGWVIMEFPVLAIVIYFLVSRWNLMGNIQFVLFGLFVFHYINRVFIYPFRIKTKGKKMPLVIALSAVVFNTVNGNIIGYSLLATSYSADYWLSISFILGMLLFIAGVIINWKSDAILISLRSKNEGYTIPMGWLFNKVSCPNFFGEIIEWLGFAIACSLMGVWSFFIWTCANLIPRALSHHRWYTSHFKEYPSNRKAIIPGLL